MHMIVHCIIIMYYDDSHAVHKFKYAKNVN